MPATSLWDLVRSIQALTAPSEAEQMQMAVDARLAQERGMMDLRREIGMKAFDEVWPTPPQGTQLTPEQTRFRNIMSYGSRNPSDGLLKAAVTQGLRNASGGGQNVPTGFIPGEQPGSITPYEINLPGGQQTNYVDYAIELARQKNAIMSPAEIQRLNIAEANLGLAQSRLMLQQAQQERERIYKSAENKRAEAAAQRAQLASERAEKIRVPDSTRNAFIQNNAQIERIYEAIRAAEDNPDAFGGKNYIPDAIMQRYDPAGVEARGKVAGVGGMEFHTMGGSTLTKTEKEQFKPYIPEITDSKDAVVKRLKGLLEKVKGLNNEMIKHYSGLDILHPLDPNEIPQGVAPNAGGWKIERVK